MIWLFHTFPSIQKRMPLVIHRIIYRPKLVERLLLYIVAWELELSLLGSLFGENGQLFSSLLSPKHWIVDEMPSVWVLEITNFHRETVHLMNFKMSTFYLKFTPPLFSWKIPHVHPSGHQGQKLRHGTAQTSLAPPSLRGFAPWKPCMAMEKCDFYSAKMTIYPLKISKIGDLPVKHHDLPNTMVIDPLVSLDSYRKVPICGWLIY